MSVDSPLLELGRQFDAAVTAARALDPDRRRLFDAYRQLAAERGIPDDALARRAHIKAMKDSGYRAVSDAFTREHGRAVTLMRRIHRKRATTFAEFAVKLSAVTFDQFDFAVDIREADGEDVAERQLIRLTRQMREAAGL